MNERERILELMKKGILSTEEGISLLEGLAENSTKQGSNDTNELDEANQYINSQEEEQLEDFKEETFEESDQDFDEVIKQVDQDSLRLNEINDELARLKSDRTDKNDQVKLLKEQYNFEKQDLKETKEVEIEDLKKELELILAIDEVDHSNEAKRLQEKLKKEEDELERIAEENFETAVDIKKLPKLEKEIDHLDEQIRKLQEEKFQVMKSLHIGRMREWSNKAKKDVTETVDLPTNWRDDASRLFNQASDSVETAGRDLNHMIQKIGQSAKDTLNSVDWSTASLKMPSITSRSFTHQFEFLAEDLDIIDFKNSNGFIHFVESQDSDKIIVEAEITLYGKMHEENELEAFEARTDIRSEEGKLSFHIPNKRIKANLTVKLPKRQYRYLAVNQLNGDVSINHLSVEDLYLKSLNGNFYLHELNAEMVETKQTNGSIIVENSTIRDLLTSTISGDIRLKGNYISSSSSTSNGDVKITLIGDDISHVEASSVNGSVKVAVPRQLDIDGIATTTFGVIKSRLEAVEDLGEDQNTKTNRRFFREGQGHQLHLDAKTTSGNILLKDTDINL